MYPLLKVGCCGFPLKKPEYAAHFPVVEIQQTFYQPPRLDTLQKWRMMVPKEFEFSIKAWQLITHSAKSPTYRRLKLNLSPEELRWCGSFQSTLEVEQAWQTTLACALALESKYVLFQCPASFSASSENITNLRRFFGSVSRAGLIFLWEPRGNWPKDLIATLCDELNLVHAVDPFICEPATKGFAYFRLHGGKGFRHVFTDEELKQLLALCLSFKEAYVMFNNIAMLNDAKRFQTLINKWAAILDTPISLHSITC